MRRIINIVLRLIEVAIFIFGFTIIDDLIIHFYYGGSVGKYDVEKYDFDRGFFSILYILFVAAYFCFVSTFIQNRQRKNKSGSELIEANKKAIVLRLVSMALSFMSLGVFFCILTNKYSSFIFVTYLFLLFFVGPRLVFLGLSDAYSWKFALICSLIFMAFALLAEVTGFKYLFLIPIGIMRTHFFRDLYSRPLMKAYTESTTLPNA